MSIASMQQYLEMKRKELGISRADVARYMGIDRATYWRKVNGSGFTLDELKDGFMGMGFEVRMTVGVSSVVFDFIVDK